MKKENNQVDRKAVVMFHKSLLFSALVLPVVFIIISHTVFDFENSGVFLSCYLFVLLIYAADFFENREVYSEYLKNTSEEVKYEIDESNLKPATVEIIMRSCLKCPGYLSCAYRKMSEACPDVLAAARFYESLKETNE